uniref:Uncharacterized protein n=1 Tax=Pipistrellus kuhlii TaxID=59472 RepID=A0A7J8A8Q9_PIPKU|nr:hypothetical protein mPipKuh1_008991 [Pipistrellus kuhlii]
MHATTKAFIIILSEVHNGHGQGQGGQSTASEAEHRPGEGDGRPASCRSNAAPSHLPWNQHGSLPAPAEAVRLPPGSHRHWRLASVPPQKLHGFRGSSMAPRNSLRFPPTPAEVAGSLLHTKLHDGLLVGKENTENKC